ncbi:MAG TPA: SGNH/GDSL hydrolase family protein [Thermoflexales bacterium]|nr:SGNH/GDSL hydrolase family protein [Thermoflexales bacterium]
MQKHFFALLLALASACALARPAQAQTTKPPVQTAPKPAAQMTLAKAIQLAVPKITARQKQTYRDAAAKGKNLNLFTVVGDCNSQPAVYVQRVANGQFNLNKQTARIQQTAKYFQPSWARVSLAARGGFSAAAMMDPTWADGAMCGTTRGPFECELWQSRASIVFVELGTGDQYEWQAFEKNYRAMLDMGLKDGVLPVLVTKADRLEENSGAPSDYINGVVRKLAKEYQLPLLDFALAARMLPLSGLLYESCFNDSKQESDPVKANAMLNACQTKKEAAGDKTDLRFHLTGAAQDLHLQLTLQTLDAIWR